MTHSSRTKMFTAPASITGKFKALSLAIVAASLTVIGMAANVTPSQAAGPVSNSAAASHAKIENPNLVEVRSRPRVRRVGKVARYNNKYYRGRRVARNVAIGVGTAVVVSGAYRYRYTCSQLARMCNNGSLSACFDHDSRCY